MALHRTVYQIEVLARIAPNDMDDLDQIAYDIREGEASGAVTRISTEEVTPERMAELLTAQGSDPSFLLGENWETEDAPRVPVFFDHLGVVDGEAYGNAVTVDGGDPIEYEITREQYETNYPDNLY